MEQVLAKNNGIRNGFEERAIKSFLGGFFAEKRVLNKGKTLTANSCRSSIRWKSRFSLRFLRKANQELRGQVDVLSAARQIKVFPHSSIAISWSIQIKYRHPLGHTNLLLNEMERLKSLRKINLCTWRNFYFLLVHIRTNTCEE